MIPIIKVPPADRPRVCVETIFNVLIFLRSHENMGIILNNSIDGKSELDKRINKNKKVKNQIVVLL